ncbi:MAG: phosphonate ABC transporter, permease protein PhnE [Bacillota bacterium]
MTQPDRNLKKGPNWQEMGGLKTALTVIAVVLIYVFSSAPAPVGLDVSMAKFVKLETWTSMGDLLVRMGPYERINTCKNAQIVWGEPTADNPDIPYSDKTDLAKVKAVCEEGKTFYWYRSDYLDEQVAYTRDIWGPLMQTLRMAILGAFFGALLAFPFSLLSARNLIRSKAVYYTVRTILSLIRTIPDLVLAAVLVGAFGLGALPGVIALTIFSFALIAKLLSESMEAIDPGPLEAVRACGGNWLQMIFYGVVPQVLPQYLAYTMYVFEVDVRASTVLGLVGAGGIGMTLYADLNLMRFRNVGAIIAVILIVVVVMELISAKVREKLV